MSKERAKEKLKDLLKPLYEAAKLEWGAAQEDYADEIVEQTISEAIVGTVHYCPECGLTPVSTKWIVDKFTYKTDKGQVQLAPKLPLRHCDTCGFEFMDYEAARIKDDAVKAYLRSCKEPGWKTRKK